jgi:hypothetical protein
MHVEAMRRIKNKLCQQAKKGVDQIAYCGLSCAHCFLTAWCGSCRTIYNTCSFATCSPNGVCPNTACCKEKGLDGCYECSELYDCKKGFYSLGKETNAIRAMALFIQKYGKKSVDRQTVIDSFMVNGQKPQTLWIDDGRLYYEFERKNGIFSTVTIYFGGWTGSYVWKAIPNDGMSLAELNASSRN